MTLEEITKEAVTSAADDVGDQAFRLWEDFEWASYANEAVQLLCEEFLLITDSSTASVCSIVVASGTAIYPYSDKILHIEEARLSGRRKPLDFRTGAFFTAQNPEWRTQIGEPTAYCIDETTGFIRFDKIPESAGTLALTVKRMPLLDLSESRKKDPPEIHPRYHKRLKHYMLFKAYSKRDTEAIDPSKANRNFELWLLDKEAVRQSELRMKKGSREPYRGYW